MRLWHTDTPNTEHTTVVHAPRGRRYIPDPAVVCMELLLAGSAVFHQWGGGDVRLATQRQPAEHSTASRRRHHRHTCRAGRILLVVMEGGERDDTLFPMTDQGNSSHPATTDAWTRVARNSSIGGECAVGPTALLGSAVVSLVCQLYNTEMFSLFDAGRVLVAPLSLCVSLFLSLFEPSVPFAILGVHVFY